MDRNALRTRLHADGWCATSISASTPDDIAVEVLALARIFGNIVPGRARQLVERIIPQTADSSFAGSLSRTYGLDTLPLHTDTAHWPRPCRYLVIACANPGPVPTPTLLVDSRRARLSKPEELACRRAVFLIRNGRHSFYGSIWERGREFIRLDPGCMTALSADGKMALQAFQCDRQRHALYRHDWKPGTILVIDNWRVLHGRGDGMPTAPGRVLLRAMVQ
jgi:alpha-ketoglutarate-dependent taurine dioxygenase